MPPAARIGDKVLQDAPHCHAPIHPALPSPTPVPHPAMPLAIIKGEPTVLIGGMPAARVTDDPTVHVGRLRARRSWDDRQRFGDSDHRRPARGPRQ